MVRGGGGGGGGWGAGESQHCGTERDARFGATLSISNTPLRRAAPPRRSGRGTHLAVVGAAVLGHGALAVHQEAVPAAFLGEGRLVSLGDEGVQLGLLAADGLHELEGEKTKRRVEIT